VLAELEADDRGKPVRGFEDLPLFQAARPAPPASQTASQTASQPAPLDAVIAALEALHPDEMSPREAMEALYALKAALAAAKG
jgi:DNA mismatch repair protein MutS